MPAFSWTELYIMPIDLRRFYYKCVTNKIKTYNEQIEATTKKGSTTPPRMPRKR